MNSVRGFSPPKPTETMTLFTHKASLTLAALMLVASMGALNSYAQGSGKDGLDCSKGSTHPRCDSVSTMIVNPGKPDTRLEMHIVNDSLLYVMVANGHNTAKAQPENENLMFKCDSGQTRMQKVTVQYNAVLELEQCAGPRGFDPLPENWIDSDVSFSYQPYEARETPDVNLAGQWLNLPPLETRDEQARGYSFARTRITITARPRSR